jgi:hypothetical protein
VRFDPDGNELWRRQKRRDTVAEEEYPPDAVAIDDAGAVYVSRYIHGAGWGWWCIDELLP